MSSEKIEDLEANEQEGVQGGRSLRSPDKVAHELAHEAAHDLAHEAAHERAHEA